MLLTLAEVVIILAAELNELKASWLGGLTTLKKHNFSCFTSFRVRSRLFTQPFQRRNGTTD